MARSIGIEKKVSSGVIINERGHKVDMTVTLEEMGSIFIEMINDHEPDDHIKERMTIKEALMLHKLLSNLPLPKLR